MASAKVWASSSGSDSGPPPSSFFDPAARSGLRHLESLWTPLVNRDGSLLLLLRRDLNVGPEYPIFIPAATYTKGGRSVTVHLLEGYIFVASGLPEVAYFALERRPYIAKVLSVERNGGLRALQVIENQHVQNLRKQLHGHMASDIPLGTVVRITDGTYSALEGEVLDIDGDHAMVWISLRSLEVIATVPRVLLQAVGE